MKQFFFFLFLLAGIRVYSQGGLQPGSKIADLALKKVLNASRPLVTLKDLEGRLIILDFFGTWCVPCIKALPALQQLQQNNNDVRVVLISVEEESKLRSFLDKRPHFPFPVVVDVNEAVTSLFQPPSLPYTVVVSKTGNVLAITEAAAIDEEKIKNWLLDNEKINITKNGVLPSTAIQTQPTGFMKSTNRTVALSQDFLYAVRTNDAVQPFVDQLETMDFQALKTTLTNDAEKKAFWINLYNGFTQVLLRKDPALYNNRSRFFKKKQFTVAGQNFSLDDLEHGILRRSKIKWSMGHLTKFFSAKWEKELRVDRLDYRIHFALNCGAKSCPPIAFYTPELLEKQLELATKNYLLNEVEEKAAENIVLLPAIMGWFRADFGGESGMRKLLREQGFSSIHSSTKIRYKDYNWSLSPNDFTAQ